jgi:hypothetical protein
LIECILTSSSIPIVQDGFRVRTAPKGLVFVNRSTSESSQFAHPTVSQRKVIFGIDGSFSTRHGSLATDEAETVTIDWLQSRVPTPSVSPSIALPSRVVTAPTRGEMCALLDMGSEDLLFFLQSNT